MTMLKAPIVSIIWTVLIVIIPLISLDHRQIFLRSDLWGFLIYFFTLTIPFDIRDLKYDHPDQKTLPQLLGESKARLFASILLITSHILIALEWYDLFYDPFFYFSASYTFILIYAIKKPKSDNYFILVDLSMIFLGLSFLSVA